MPPRWEKQHWRRLYTKEEGDFALLPLYVRALAAQLIKLAEDSGRIPLRGRDPADVIGYTFGATRGDRRLLREHIPMLLKDGYLELRDGDLWIRNFPVAQRTIERGSSTTEQRPSNERGVSLPDDGRSRRGSATRNESTPPRSSKSALLDKRDKRDKTRGKRVPAAPAAVRVSAAIDPVSSGAPTPRSSAREPRGAVFPPDPVSPGGPDPKTAHTAALALTRDSAFHRAVDGFHELFKAHRRGASPAWGEKQGAMIKKLLARVQGDPERVLEYARRMFAMAPRWPAENPDLGTLVAHWDKFAPQPARRIGGFLEDEQREYQNGDLEL